jgi:DNA-binding NarL/FixJ family response regulator
MLDSREVRPRVLAAVGAESVTLRPPAQAGVAQAEHDGPEADAAATRVLLIDDHRAFAESLALAIDQHEDLACVGTATTIEEGLAAVDAANPDVVLIDIYLPDGDGIDAIPAIRARSGEARILVMTGHTDLDGMTRAASAGAGGFLPKESSVGAVLTAIRAAHDGQMLIDGSTLAAILGRVGRRPGGAGGSPTDEAKLTPRELDVLDLMRQGLDPHAIAAHLGISLHTCRGYQKAILAKLGAHSQLEAVVIAARRGLIERLDR